MADFKKLKNLIDPHKQPTAEFFGDLLDGDKQRAYEDEHISAVMVMLKAIYIARLREKIAEIKKERGELRTATDYNAEKYTRILELNAEEKELNKKIDCYKPFFNEPYFARMDVTDEKEGYNSYYIGKRGDEKLEIVDWRAPLAQKYYQKSRTSFSINDYNYKLILRRSLRTLNGKVVDMKNEYLNVSDYLSKEEIAGRDEALVFDPFLKEILKSRKEKSQILDIIETIQEKQFEIITLPERDEFVLQGVAGSGKTMIMLHRLSYIMYNNEKLRPTDVLVLTPSDSFNDFIDELSGALELERVRTSTLDSYFLAVLKNAGVDIAAKLDYSIPIDENYLKYVYSTAFVSDVGKRLEKIYSGVTGMFLSDDCRAVAEETAAKCDAQTGWYEKIKNASLRVRRCVLGEIKEKPDGGLYYTKQFRYMFNCVLNVNEFLSLVSGDERMKNYSFFYSQFIVFYKSLRFLKKFSAGICRTAANDLVKLKEAVDREILDLNRYKMKLGDREVLTYAENIEKREALKKEIDTISSLVDDIAYDFASLYEFAEVLCGDGYLAGLGKCDGTLDIARFFYREIVKKAKKKFGIESKALLRCDPFCLLVILTKLGYNLSPKFSFLFIDEGQDISVAEYDVLRAINDRATFNVFGDLKQNITPFRGVGDWEKLGLKEYNLNLNYRNTNEIVDYVSENCGIEMSSIGLGGVPVQFISKRSATGWLSGKNGLKALICSDKALPAYIKKTYNVTGSSGKISKTKINAMTVYESKGLEFTAVCVVADGMTVNELYVACTRALNELAIIV